MYCQVCHPTAYLSFLTGLKPREVYAKFDYAGSVNDIYNALTISYEGGTLAGITSTAATPLAERNYEIRIYGTKAVLFLELWRGHGEIVPFEGERQHLPDLSKDEIYPEQAPAINLVDSALGVAPNGSDGRLGLSSMEVIEAACASAKSGQAVRIERP